MVRTSKTALNLYQGKPLYIKSLKSLCAALDTPQNLISLQAPRIHGKKSSVSFKTEIKIHFDDADPAGICFFAKIFAKTHHAYEEFITHLGQDPRLFFSGKEFIVPIRHTEANYLSPLMALEEYSVGIGVSKISESSFTLNYEVTKKGSLCVAVATTHVFLKANSKEKCPIPDDFKAGLEKHKTRP